ncbi:hypothetical protein LCGC14_0812490 [marine sediment metagenome]|uniref:Uncharacterized protein n=1 Tax=marine sediment metagenome TaxID=412755 RepID=A0A0F9PQS6_9ZZZZ
MAVDFDELKKRVAIKRLVVAGNDDIYYEDLDVSAGTMTELDTSSGAIDTSDQLMMFEAYQKVFVVNGANLKVADFVNTKITVSAMTAPPGKGDILTQAQGGSDKAYMVVDFVNSDKTLIYGYAYYGGSATAFNTTVDISSNNATATMNPSPIPHANISDIAGFINARLTHSALGTAHASGDILTQANTGAKMTAGHTNTAKTATYGAVTTGTFNTTDQVTGSGSGSAFTPTAVRLPGPHWYDWTVSPDIVLTSDGSTKSYGTMPNKLYLGCLYKGRGIGSGNPEHPEQWYMTRQGNLYDFAYIANDTGTPVAGGNADAGESGDIVRALIPYKDDYLIFGCASTLWYIVGDPAYGGDLLELDLTAGILGAKAHCWDNAENLYILATTGLLKIPKGFGAPENLTTLSYPNFIKALAYDAALHRITMGYDRIRQGIVISKTTLADGVNSCWWYDLRTDGLFPESYPNQCGMYSMFYYEANDPDYKELLFGCKDGYIRTADDTAKSDDIGDSDEAIDSYYTLGPIRMGSETREGVFTSLLGVPAGGRTVGSLTNSSDIDWKLWTAETADELVEKLLANTSPKIAGTMAALGSIRGARKRRDVRGMYMGIRLGNDTAAETWSLERLQVNIRQGGRLK